MTRSVNPIITAIPIACFILYIALTLTSCVKSLKEDPPAPGPEPETPYFPFTTTVACTLNIDYGLEDYPVLFEIFDADPLSLTEEGAVKTTGEPLFRAATDQKGCFSGKIILPNHLTEIYLYSDFPGTAGPVKLEIPQSGNITFNQKERRIKASASSTKALASNGNGYTYPDKFKVLGKWDRNGRPGYLIEPAILTAQQLYDAKNTFNLAGGQKIKDYPQSELIAQENNIRIDIVKPTAIKLIFIKTTATMRNVFGYYTYKTGEEPVSVSDIQPVIAFPHISVYNCNLPQPDALFTGDQIQLKYWNEDRQVFEDQFPAGVSIGWFLNAYAFDPSSGNISDNKPVYYASRSLNAGRMHRSIALRDGVSNRMVAIGFEDSGITDAGQGNFCDAVFFLDYGDEDAVDQGGTGTMEPTPGITEADNYHVVSGTLTFEDLWPSQGDYDMNDVVVSYKSTLYKNVVSNMVTRIVDEFTFVHNGGTIPSGFGFQHDALSKEVVKNVKIESADNTASSFMKGLMLEPGQSKPNIILFDNARKVAPNTLYTVTTELNHPVPMASVQPPYNPYIIIDTEKGRGRELHLANQIPTDLADSRYFKTGADVSDAGQGIYYLSKDKFPFAINLPGITDFRYPEETVRIDKAYPAFSGWVQSDGVKYRDWYKKPGN